MFQNEIRQLDLTDLWNVDSAAILRYHVGNNPEPRAIATLRRAGITNYRHIAREITREDFYNFDWIFAMDSYILSNLCQMEPLGCHAKIELLGQYDPERELEIRDPLFDQGSEGFQKAYEQAIRSVRGFLDQQTNGQS